MTNEVTQDAEESTTIEKTAVEQDHTSNPTAASAPAQADATPTADATAAVSSDAPAAEAPAAPEPPPAAQPPAQPTGSAAPAQGAASAKPAEEQQPSADIDFGAILEQFEQEQTVFHSGEMVSGTVVGVTDRGVLVDFGYKSEGFVPVEEFTGPDGEMMAKVGEPVDVVIRSIHSGDSAPQLSRTDAVNRKVWDEIESAFQDEKIVTGRVVDRTKGGLRVDLNGIEAFLPGSQIDSRPVHALESYLGQDIEARIIKFSRRRNNIVLSRKILTDELVNAQKAETLNKIDVGYIVDGTIKNLTEYGAFVDIGGIDGLLHVTDMSWGRVNHPADMFNVADHIQVKVLKLDREKEKISLGYKQLQPDPWSTVVEVYPVNSKLKGTVSSVTDYGVFVELEPGVEGLVHVSEISWSRRAQSPKRIFHKGQEVEVQVLGVDTEEKRISLGMKQFIENPWETVDIKFPVGARVQGRVRNLTDFGAFVELEEGIDGLVHVSDISWGKKIKHPKDILKKDQEVEAIVTSIDKRNQRLSLSMKDLTPSAWEGFVATHRPGDVVRGKVSRFTNFGVFVELGEGLEGLCHISELSDERVDRPESVAELGQEMDFKILRIEPADQKIGLSHRAVGKEDEPIVDTRIYSSEAKGGMASLGELANLRRSEAEEAPQEDPEAKKAAKLAAKKAKAEEFAAREAEAAARAEAGETDDEPAAEAAETAEAAVEDAPASDASTETTATSDEPAGEVPAGEVPAEEAAASEAPAEESVPIDEPAAEAAAAEQPSAETNEPETATAGEAEASEPAVETPAAEDQASAAVADQADGGGDAAEVGSETTGSETGEAAEEAPVATDGETAADASTAEDTPSAETESGAESVTAEGETASDESPTADGDSETQTA